MPEKSISIYCATKAFGLASLLFILPVLSRGQQNIPIENKLAFIQLNGYNFCNPPDFNERMFQQVKIINQAESPKTVVFGSSRSFHLDSHILEDDKIMNHAVSGGSLEDILALYSIYEEKKATPENLILGLDPWIFNANNDQDRWKVLEDSYQKMILLMRDKIEIQPSEKGLTSNEFNIYFSSDYNFRKDELAGASALNINMHQLFNDLSFVNINDSIHVIVNRLVQNPWLYDSLIPKYNAEVTSSIKALAEETTPYRGLPFTTLQPYQKDNILKLNRLLLVVLYNFPDNELFEGFPTLSRYHKFNLTYLKDGGLQYAQEVRERDSSIVASKAWEWSSYSVLKFTQFDPEKKAQFESFINYLVTNKKQITLFMAPYHPNVFQMYRTEKRYSLILEFEEYAKTIALKEPTLIKIVGSFNPTHYKLNSSDFYDGMHLKEKGVRKVLRSHKLIKSEN